MGKLKNKLIDDEDQVMTKLTTLYVVTRNECNVTAFRTYEKAVDYCNFMKELYDDCNYEFDVDSLDLEE